MFGDFDMKNILEEISRNRKLSPALLSRKPNWEPGRRCTVIYLIASLGC
jgi:hypothetical protein